MQLLSKKSLQALTHYPIGSNQENVAINTWNPMLTQHTCPCCSYTLLRHVRLKGIYWHCSHCYQEMPAY